jgi:hypothetical protein
VSEVLFAAHFRAIYSASERLLAHSLGDSGPKEGWLFVVDTARDGL